MTHKFTLRLAATAVAAALSLASSAHAQEAYLSEVRSFGFDFCPRGWTAAAGQLFAINQNQALFSLLGTTFGGDGRTSFGLPDLRGRTIVGQGQSAASGTRYLVGERGGTDAVTLTQAQLPAHTHSVRGNTNTATLAAPGNAAFAASNAGGTAINTYGAAPANTGMNGSIVSNVGGSQAHDNRMPYLATTWCIATTGTFPSRQ